MNAPAASHDIVDSKLCNCNALKAQSIWSPSHPLQASADTLQMEALHSRRTYDYRIKEAIYETGDRDLFPQLNIPRSTIRSWIHRGTTDVVSCDSVENDRTELVAEIENLRPPEQPTDPRETDGSPFSSTLGQLRHKQKPPNISFTREYSRAYLEHETGFELATLTLARRC